MKIAFASEDGRGLESMVAHHFGRCPYYVFVEVEGKEVKRVETKENPFFERHEPGIVPEFVAKEGAGAIVAGGMGPRALEWFEKLGVNPVTGAGGTVESALKQFLEGKLSGAEPCDEH